MAKKRMFCTEVVETGRFRDLSKGARLLYYDLGMAADDDGVAEGKQVLRSTAAKRADLAELEHSGYVRVLDDHLAVWITDWKLNNRIPRDRYHPGPYVRIVRELERERDGDKMSPEREQNVDEMSPEREQNVDKMSPEWEQNADKMSTEVRSGKDRSVKDSKEKVREACPEAPKREGRFTPPTAEEVGAYVLERGSDVDPQRFVDFYASKGWRVGSQPMKDWRAAVRTWERREDRGGGQGPVPSEADYREGW